MSITGCGPKKKLLTIDNDELYIIYNMYISNFFLCAFFLSKMPLHNVRYFFPLVVNITTLFRHLSVSTFSLLHSCKHMNSQCGIKQFTQFTP